MNSGQNMGVFWVILEWILAGLYGILFSQKVCDGPRLRNMDGWLVRKIQLDPGWRIWKEDWLEILERSPAGITRRIFFGKHESEALGKMDGDVGGWSEGGCPSVKRIGPGLGECVEWMLGGINGQPTAHRFQNQGCPLIRTETPVLKDEIYC